MRLKAALYSERFRAFVRSITGCGELSGQVWGLVGVRRGEEKVWRCARSASARLCTPSQLWQAVGLGVGLWAFIPPDAGAFPLVFPTARPARSQTPRRPTAPAMCTLDPLPPPLVLSSGRPPTPHTNGPCPPPQTDCSCNVYA
eukprot:357327-Chlamydomonas_euryale.AAC.8